MIAQAVMGVAIGALVVAGGDGTLTPRCSRALDAVKEQALRGNTIIQKLDKFTSEETLASMAILGTLCKESTTMVKDLRGYHDGLVTLLRRAERACRPLPDSHPERLRLRLLAIRADRMGDLLSELDEASIKACLLEMMR